MLKARQLQHFYLPDFLQFFGVDDRTFPSERHSPTGIARAATTRHDGQAQIDTGFDQFCHVSFAIGSEHHKRVFHPPIGGIGDMRDTAHGVKADVVVVSAFAKHFAGFYAQARHLCKTLGKGLHRLQGCVQQSRHHGVALRVLRSVAALVNFIQPMLHGLHQRLTAFGVVQ